MMKFYRFLPAVVIPLCASLAVASPTQHLVVGNGVSSAYERYAGLELLPVGDQEPDAPVAEAETIAPPEEPITFTAPLTVGGPEVEGKSLEELIAGSPLFTPIEGLPDVVWKDKSCSDCHQWTPQALCTQGGTYLKEKTAWALGKEHPYGGGFKQNLRFWAVQECK